MPNPTYAINASQGVRAAGQTTIPLGFTPTAGNALVLMTFAAANQTVVGWTAHLEALADGEISFFTKTSDGTETSVTYSQNGPRALAYAFLELPAGTTFSGGSNSGGTDDTIAAVTGLPAGNKIVIWQVGRVFNSPGTWDATWGGDYVEFAQQYAPHNGDEGAGLTVGFYEGTATATTGTVVTTGGQPTRHKMVVAAYLPAGPPPNTAPTANAGVDQSVQVNAQVTLNGSGSNDPDGTIASYSWAQTAGTTVALSGTGANRTFTPTSAGTYTFQLTVTDDDGSTGTDSVNIVASSGNAAPTANAGVDQNVTANNQVTLTGAGSSDSDGTIASYSWNQVSGTTVTLAGTGATRTFTPTVAGTYVFGLTVTDNLGLTSSQDQVTVTVASAPGPGTMVLPPSAFNGSQGILAQGATAVPLSFTPTNGRILLMAMASSAVQTVSGWTKHLTSLSGGELAYFYKTVSGDGNSIPFTQNAARPVAYSVLELPGGTTFSVGENVGTSDDAWPSGPTTGFAAGLNKIVLWTALRNTGSAGAVASATWGGDATEMTELASAHEGSALFTGFYEGVAQAVSATMDTSASTGLATQRQKLILAAYPPPVVANVGPTASAGADQNVAVNATVTLNGAGSTDSDGTISSYVWTQTAGTGVTLNGSGSNRTFTPTTTGSRTFQLTVTDDDGATATDTVVINVTSGNVPPVASAGADQSVNVNTQVTLNGVGSSDSDGTISSYSWSQVSGTTVSLVGSGASRTFTPTTAGAYTFQLTVTDNTGATGTDTVLVTVTNPASNYGATVATENTRTGDPSNQWWDGLSPLGLPSFGRRTYYAPGETARFSVDCATAFNVTIHRLGHYGGTGARIVQAAFAGTPATQPAPVAIAGGNGAVTCAAWAQNAQWAVPADALPGWYMATFRRTSDSQHGYALFMVSDASAKKPTLIVTGDATWHAAYSGFGGNNVYGASVSIGNIGERAFCSTYDKPVLTHAHVPQTHFFNNSYPYLAWSERMGYEAGVATIEQIKDDPTIMDGRQLIVWVGHNEYIPQQVMDKTKSLLLGGQNMVNIAGNDFFWRVKFTDGAFTSPNTGRIMWCKKDTMTGPSSGPDAVPGHVAGQPFTTPADWTGTWQDTRWTLREPSEDFFGDQFIANGIRADAVKVPASMKNLPPWRNCASILSLTGTQEYTFAAGTLGMEWDRPMMANPNVEQYLFSSTEIDLVNNAADENGQTYGQTSNDTIHGFAMVKKDAGYIANFNSDQWAWALSQRHLRGNVAPDNNAMQMMLNVISDLGVQPTSSSVTGAGLTVPTPVSLAEYGFDVSTDPGGGTGGTPDSPTWQELIDAGYVPHITVVL